VKTWPAADVRVTSDPDQIIAAVDDFSPTAAEERGDTLRVFFASAAARDAAVAVLGSGAVPVDVDDEDWAARSQAGLSPVAVGRVTVLPSEPARAFSPGRADETIAILIRPSMGFGTGHHATTRLCLASLQDEDVSGKTVLDVGTGSGILAIAASRLGAASAIGIDTDPDAIESAHLNLTLNPEITNVRFAIGDLEAGLEAADILLANLTGALLARTARTLLAAVRPGGTLIVSGILDEEEAVVRRACEGAHFKSRRQEGEWVGLAFNPGVSSSV
jgi:ribosomal protein L11 methyltransferase